MGMNFRVLESYIIMCKKLNLESTWNGLNKFQPNDLNSADMIDLDIITKDDRQNILNIYDDMKSKYNYKQIEKINDIIAKYVK